MSTEIKKKKKNSEVTRLPDKIESKTKLIKDKEIVSI